MVGSVVVLLGVVDGNVLVVVVVWFTALVSGSAMEMVVFCGASLVAVSGMALVSVVTGMTVAPVIVS